MSPGLPRGQARVIRSAEAATEATLRPRGDPRRALHGRSRDTLVHRRRWRRRGGILSHAAAVAREYGIPTDRRHSRRNHPLRRRAMRGGAGAAGTVTLEASSNTRERSGREAAHWQQSSAPSAGTERPRGRAVGAVERPSARAQRASSDTRERSGREAAQWQQLSARAQRASSERGNGAAAKPRSGSSRAPERSEPQASAGTERPPGRAVGAVERPRAASLKTSAGAYRWPPSSPSRRSFEPRCSDAAESPVDASSRRRSPAPPRGRRSWSRGGAGRGRPPQRRPRSLARQRRSTKTHRA